MDSPELKRGIFGYTSKNVERTIAERERSSHTALEEARVAQARAAELQKEIDQIRLEQERWAEEILAAQRESDAARVSTEQSRAELEAMRNELEATRADLEGARGALADSGTELESTLKAREAQAERAAAAERASAQLHEDLRSTRSELDSSRGELGTANRKLETLTRELQSVRESLRTTRIELRDTKLELNASKGAGAAKVDGDVPRVSGGPSSTRELASVLESTQKAFTLIVDDARRNAAKQMGEIERERDRLEEKVGELRAWLDHVVPLIEAARTSVEARPVREQGAPARSIADLPAAPVL